MRQALLVGLICSCLAAASGSVRADEDLAIMKLAQSLGDVLAAESFCGLSYEQAAIKSFIDRNVPASDLEFARHVDNHARMVSDRLPKLSPSRETAFCEQMSRAARHYGFTR